jgi:hypothetical protein
MLRSYSLATFSPKLLGVPKKSTITEWSMTRSTGLSGLIFSGSPPSLARASRMAARSTTAGTPVKSCISTRAGRKAISCCVAPLFSIQAPIALRSSSVTEPPSSLRSRFSSSTFIDTGKREIPVNPASSAAGRL